MLVLSLALADRIRVLKLNRLQDQSYLIERERQMNEELKDQVTLKTQELKQLADRFEQESITDSLTGLKNRRTFDSIMALSVGEKDRDNPWLCLALIDLDYFKNFNDRYGHPAGDALLKQLGNLLQNTFQRSDDHVFRIGGEEFGIVFRIESTEDIEPMMTRFQSALADISLQTVADPVTASIGIACVPNGTPVTPGELYVRADELLYHCKEAGRNQFRIERVHEPLTNRSDDTI
jgi:diguanylate cyclase (GGDEF)-like protein